MFHKRKRINQFSSYYLADYCTIRFLDIGPPKNTRQHAIFTNMIRVYVYQCMHVSVGIYHIEYERMAHVTIRKIYPLTFNFVIDTVEVVLQGLKPQNTKDRVNSMTSAYQSTLLKNLL